MTYATKNYGNMITMWKCSVDECKRPYYGKDYCGRLLLLQPKTRLTYCDRQCRRAYLKPFGKR